MAGAEDEKPAMTTEEIVSLIKNAGFVAVERDTIYNVIRQW
jgi:aminodeoxyfutalosine synthase